MLLRGDKSNTYSQSDAFRSNNSMMKYKFHPVQYNTSEIHRLNEAQMHLDHRAKEENEAFLP